MFLSTHIYIQYNTGSVYGIQKQKQMSVADLVLLEFYVITVSEKGERKQ